MSSFKTDSPDKKGLNNYFLSPYNFKKDANNVSKYNTPKHSYNSSLRKHIFKSKKSASHESNVV